MRKNNLRDASIDSSDLLLPFLNCSPLPPLCHARRHPPSELSLIEVRALWFCTLGRPARPLPLNFPLFSHYADISEFISICSASPRFLHALCLEIQTARCGCYSCVATCISALYLGGVFSHFFLVQEFFKALRWRRKQQEQQRQKNKTKQKNGMLSCFQKLSCDSYYQFTMTVCLGLLKVRSQTDLMMESRGEGDRRGVKHEVRWKREEEKAGETDELYYSQRDNGCWSGNAAGSLYVIQRGMLCFSTIWGLPRRLMTMEDHREQKKHQRRLQLVCQTPKQRVCVCVCVCVCECVCTLKQSLHPLTVRQIVNPILSARICIWNKKPYTHTHTHTHTLSFSLAEAYLQTSVYSGGSIPPVRRVNLSKCHITEAATCASPLQPVR